jgi:hypothetical protein
MKLVQDPRHPTRCDHSVSVAGKEYFIENGVIDGIPEHLAKNFEGHGLIPEGTYLLYMALEAEQDHKRIEQEARDEDTRKKIQAEHLDSIREEERVRVQTRFEEENRLRALHRDNDRPHTAQAGPHTENPQEVFDAHGRIVNANPSGGPARAVETGGKTREVFGGDYAKAGSRGPLPKRSVPMTARA